ncbi:PTS glucose transporter subunit IIA [Lactiplantibacillus nangangensis]|uniref:PTS glucose transporter subunit IIA n=1 Tax=Lactiplantibacillus nangangensis TaxID=2559917 RepID=A0ABW1SNL2_9LACO|nr:PTS glucose transporter subunit IIA [Lactiplantibacillus nangangensis]
MGLFNQRKKLTLVAPTNGQLMALKDVSDVVYARGPYGIGFAVEPTSNQVVSPIAGTISSYFPTKHAIGIQADKLEVLIHMGIDTVELNGNPFQTLVKVGDQVEVGTPLSIMDLAAIRKAGKATTTMVVVINAKDQVKRLRVPATGKVTVGEELGKVVEV